MMLLNVIAVAFAVDSIQLEKISRAGLDFFTPEPSAEG